MIYNRSNINNDDNKYFNRKTQDQMGFIATISPIPLDALGRITSAHALVVAAPMAVAVTRARVLAVRYARLDHEGEVARGLDPDVVRGVGLQERVVQPDLEVVAGPLAVPDLGPLWGDAEFHLLGPLGELCVALETDDEGLEGGGLDGGLCVEGVEYRLVGVCVP